MHETNPNNQIRKYRRKCNFKLKDVALLMNKKSSAHISHWEKGRKLPNLKNTLLLSATLKCPTEVLFSDLFARVRHEVFERKKSHNLFERYD